MPWRDTREIIAQEPRDADILARLCDAHCHPIDTPGFDDTQGVVRNVATGKMCVMSTTLHNQDDTTKMFETFPDRVIPFYGCHPWFVHQISMDKNLSKDEHYRSVLTPIGKEGMDETVLKMLIDGLISPLPLPSFLVELESNLGSREGAMLGEVGIDKAFRLPNPPEFTHIHKNSSMTTTLVHQLRVLEAQIEVAIRLRRNISFHSVRSPHDTLDFLNRLKRTDSGFQEINICLHSFSGSPETVNQIQKAHHNVFFSFATLISGRSPGFSKMLSTVQRDRILLESDYHDAAGIDDQMWLAFEALTKAQDWTNEDCACQLETNWRDFTSAPKVVMHPRNHKMREMESNKSRGEIADLVKQYKAR